MPDLTTTFQIQIGLLDVTVKKPDLFLFRFFRTWVNTQLRWGMSSSHSSDSTSFFSNLALSNRVYTPSERPQKRCTVHLTPLRRKNWKWLAGLIKEFFRHPMDLIYYTKGISLESVAKLWSETNLTKGINVVGNKMARNGCKMVFMGHTFSGFYYKIGKNWKQKKICFLS